MDEQTPADGGDGPGAPRFTEKMLADAKGPGPVSLFPKTLEEAVENYKIARYVAIEAWETIASVEPDEDKDESIKRAAFYQTAADLAVFSLSEYGKSADKFNKSSKRIASAIALATIIYAAAFVWSVVFPHPPVNVYVDGKQVSVSSPPASKP